MIKKIFSILFLWLCWLGVMAQTDLHKLSTAIMPTKAGTVSVSGNEYEAGSSVWVYTYGNENYRFKCWMTDDKEIVSSESGFYYMMPDKDVTLTAVYEYDPESPGNPEGITEPHTLTLKSSPSRGGYFNYRSGDEVNQGTELHLNAYSNSHYQFKHWEYQGKVVSYNYWYVFTMPDAAAELVAVFTYNPASPVNPGTNSWNASTGELIIDDFSEGNLYYVIDNMTGGNGVQTLIVSGKISDYDLGGISGLPIKNFDLSRCAGTTTVPSWSFYGNTAITEISLPSSITNIESLCFSDCTNLTKVDCYAAVPPTLAPDAFNGISNQLTVYVPSDSYDIYKNAPGWKNLKIRRMGVQVHAVEIDLPDDVYALYKNMYIELVNEQSGEKMRYVITDRMAYTFKNLVPETTWTAYLKNANDQILGSVKGIAIGDEDQIVQFASLIQPQTVRAEVLANGEDVASQVTLTWLNSDGTYLGQGTSISGILPLDGVKVALRINLPQALAMEYQQPEDVVYTVQTSNNLIRATLVALPRVQITGKVKDVTTGNPIEGAIVTVSQASYNKAFTVKTDAQGAYSIAGAYVAPTSVTVAATDYIGQTAEYETLPVAGETASMDDIALKSVNGAHINVNFTYKLSAEAGQPAETQDFFADYVNVTYTIHNMTTGLDILLFNVKGQEIVLKEEQHLGDQLKITATSKTNAFEPLTATGVIDNNNRVVVTFEVKQLGQLRATYVSNENPSVTGILYDANGKFVRSATYEEGSLLFTELTDGQYTLVTMGNSSIFNSIYDLGKYAESGLVRGTDYASAAVSVESGLISVVKTPLVPYLNLSKFDYMGNSTTFTVNKNLITIGNNLTFTGFITFKSNYVNAISDVKLLIDIPETCKMVDGSVMVGNDIVNYTFANSRLVIPVEDISNRIRFCIKPVVAGDYAPSAYVQFRVGGQQMIQPIGNAAFVAENMGISVPNVTKTATFPASGTALARSVVKVYDDDILVGMALALANGTWSATCELVDPENKSKHNIFARISTNDVEMVTETQTLTYEETEVELNTITMLNTAHPATSLALRQYVTTFNFLHPQTRLAPYWYWPDYPDFTFLVDFSNNGAVNPDDFELIVFTSDNKYISLKPVYNLRRKCFVVTHKFYYYALPISVNIRRKGDTGKPRMFTRVEYVLDPSGYVYEGVPSNRLEGVTATIYYRKDENDTPVLWDASSYDQENPLLTDEYGMYAWDVPEGQWRVKFEKEGYETTYSEWLPVPPPQLKVNIPMVQSTAPKVSGATADAEGVEVKFDKYMKAATLTTDNIIVTYDNEVVQGTVELLDKENADEEDESSPLLASRVRFKFNESFPDNGEVQLLVNTAVKSYADMSLTEVYKQDLDIQVPVKTIAVDEVFAVEYEGTRELTVSTLPVGSAAGKTLRARMLSTTIAGIEEDEDGDGEFVAILDANGQATLTISGDLPGSTALQFSIDDTEVEGQTLVKVQQVKSLVSNAPSASYANGSDVYRGTLINLISDDESAKIYYTISTDGMEPADPTTESTLYTLPIAIDAGMVKIKAIAKAEGFEQSAVASFEYTIKQNTSEMAISEGWNWVSHNLSNPIAINELSGINSIVEVKNQTRGVVRDAVYGLFGNLAQMEPTENYKVKATASTKVSRGGDAFNAAKGVINLKKGWNWIGYPMKSAMPVDEAMANFNPSEGDVIVGLEGSAEYADGTWYGDLGNMNPGMGYMIKVADTEDLLYNTSAASGNALKAKGRLSINRSPWSVDVHSYPNVMPMRIKLYRDGQPIDDSEFSVAAFSGTGCRGIGKSVNGVVFMNVHGDSNETITFLVADNNTDQVISVEETLPFQSDVVGSFHAPYELHMAGGAVGIQEHNSQMGVWPVVARTEINVSLAGKTIDLITVTGTDGKMVYASKASCTTRTINVSNLPAGVYVVMAQSGKEFFYKKITKVNK